MFKNCFRPLTGTLLSKLEMVIEIKEAELVSVPSRGLSYLNTMKKIIDQSLDSFRPLTGTLLSKH